MAILSFFFYIILFFVLFVLVTVGVLIFRFWNVIRMVFGGQQRSRSPYGQPSASGNPGGSTSSSNAEQPRRRAFDKDEGEYVDFEEISD